MQSTHYQVVVVHYVPPPPPLMLPLPPLLSELEWTRRVHVNSEASSEGSHQLERSTKRSANEAQTKRAIFEKRRSGKYTNEAVNEAIEEAKTKRSKWYYAKQETK